MSDILKSLMEKRAAVSNELRTHLAEAGAGEDGYSAEERSKTASINAELDRLEASINAEEKFRKAEMADAEVVEARVEETGTPAEQYSQAFGKMLRAGGISGLNAADAAIIQRAQVVGTDSLGGFTVPEGFWNRVSEAMLAFGDVQNLVRNISTTTGNDLPWMTADETAVKGAILAELATVGTRDLTFGQKTLRAFMYASGEVSASYQFLQDTSIDAEGYIARKLGESLGRIYADHITFGVGTTEPEGLVTNATLGVTAASATAITFNEILELIHSVDPAYRNGRTRLMFNDATLLLLRQLTDLDGRPLWEPSLTPGVPSQLGGVPYSINQSMADPTTGNTAVLYGDFTEGYVWRTVRGMSVISHDLNIRSLQKSWFAISRADGIQDQANAYKSLVML